MLVILYDLGALLRKLGFLWGPEGSRKSARRRIRLKVTRMAEVDCLNVETLTFYFGSTGSDRKLPFRYFAAQPRSTHDLFVTEQFWKIQELHNWVKNEGATFISPTRCLFFASSPQRQTVRGNDACMTIERVNCLELRMPFNLCIISLKSMRAMSTLQWYNNFTR